MKLLKNVNGFFLENIDVTVCNIHTTVKLKKTGRKIVKLKMRMCINLTQDRISIK